MQLLVQVASPFGAIAHVVHDALISDQFSCAAFPCAAAEFHFGDDVVWNVHTGNYTGYCSTEKISCSHAGDLFVTNHLPWVLLDWGLDAVRYPGPHVLQPTGLEHPLPVCHFDDRMSAHVDGVQEGNIFRHAYIISTGS